VLDPVPSGPEVPPLPGIEGVVDPLPGGEHLVDGPVSDRVDTDLQTRHVPAVEELRELVIGDVPHAGASIGVGLGQPRRSGADRAVDRQIAADRAEAVADGHSQVGGGHHGHRVDGQPRAMREQHTEIPVAAPVRHRHLVHGGDAS
jgi:hypothetical protein